MHRYLVLKSKSEQQKIQGMEIQTKLNLKINQARSSNYPIIMTKPLKTFKFSLTLIFLGCLASHAYGQTYSNLILNGSFEERTTPAAPTSGFSSGLPDDWVEITTTGGPYLVHESHGTVPGNAAIDGEIILGGNQNLIVSQMFSVTETGALSVSWWGNNETLEERPDTNFYYTAVQFNDGAGDLIEWSGYRDNYDPDVLVWFPETYTTATAYTPGTYEVQFFVGGLTSVDNLVVTQIPEPSVALLFGVFAISTVFVRRRN